LIKAVFLDCWGTILKAPDLMRRGATTEHFHRILTSHGHILDYEEFRNSYSVATRRQNQINNVNWEEFDHEERLRETIRAIGFKHPDLSGIVNRVWKEYLKEWSLQSTLYQETMPLLKYLKEKYKLGLITNFVDGPTARGTFKKYRFGDIFGIIVISGEEGFRKPKPIIFEKALSGLNVIPEESVMIGDTLVADIIGPKEIGMKTILVDVDGSKEGSYNIPDAVVHSIGKVRDVLFTL
jgi:putative hydrolase of the HAD superfamily